MTFVQDFPWVRYLERRQPLFLFAIVTCQYGRPLQDETGFGFSKQLQFFKGERGVFYKLDGELQASDSYYAALLLEHPERVKDWIEKNHLMGELFDRMKTESDVEIIIGLFEQILLFNTVIPFRLLAAIEQFPKLQSSLDAGLFEELLKCREVSFYPQIVDTVLPKVFAQIAERLGVSAELGSLVTHKEAIAVLKGEQVVSESDLMARKAGTYLFVDEENTMAFQHSFVDVLDQEDLAISEIKGKVAFSGWARGVARVLNAIDEATDFQKGDILVSINTNPSLMPVMQKAAAIVSDEGGITCHAAIVSRELKIPCVIGTKIASKIIKTGDLVEVDAETGVVRKLS